MSHRYSLIPIYNKWVEDYQNIYESFGSLDIAALEGTYERDIFVEGLFLRLVTSWESFIEEVFLRSMCKAKTRASIIIKPKRALRNTNDAFTVLASDTSRNRENHYLNWLDTTNLSNWCSFHFRNRSRFDNVIPNYINSINQINTIRNRIVHSSRKSYKSFNDLIRNNYGYLSPTSNSPTSFLLGMHRRRRVAMFIFYMEELNELCDSLSR